MTEQNNSVFNELNALNVGKHIEKKNGLSYLSWSFAWQAFKKVCPNATYEVVKFDGVPYLETPLGLMCYTKVTANDLTHEMWLPVMDTYNQAMKSQPYEIQTRKGKRVIQAATMTDVNKTIMRCLVKNLAMFGLGLYIYAGEDLPEAESEAIQRNQQLVNDVVNAYNTGNIDQVKTLVSQNNGLMERLTPEWQQAINKVIQQEQNYHQEIQKLSQQMNEAVSIQMLEPLFTAAYRMAKAQNDNEMIRQLANIKDQRKAQLEQTKEVA